MLGVFFAVTAEQEKALVAADEDEVAGIVVQAEEEWGDRDLTCDMDKAWDGVHRSLTDGTLDPDGGGYPLSHAVLGGRHLTNEIYAVLVTADQVREVAAALREVTRDVLRVGFDRIDASEYRGARDDRDFAYTWEDFEDMRGFYHRAAEAGRAVLFTAM
jgi:hypothetical protein